MKQQTTTRWIGPHRVRVKDGKFVTNIAFRNPRLIMVLQVEGPDRDLVYLGDPELEALVALLAKKGRLPEETTLLPVTEKGGET